MSRHRRPRPTLLAALVLLGVLTMSACSLTDADDPGKATVTDEIAAVGEALGVPSDQVSLFGYGVTRDLAAEDCPEVEDGDDRWIAERSAVMAVPTQQAAIDGLVRHYRDLGAELYLYKSRASEGRTLYVVDTARDVHVDVDLGAEGRVALFVRHTPCGVADLTTGPNTPVEPEPLPG